MKASKEEIRYVVVCDFEGQLRIQCLKGTVRKATIRVHRTVRELGYRSIIGFEMWNGLPKSKQEAIEQKLKEWHESHSGYLRKCEDLLECMNKLNTETERLLK